MNQAKRDSLSESSPRSSPEDHQIILQSNEKVAYRESGIWDIPIGMSTVDSSCELDQVANNQTELTDSQELKQSDVDQPVKEVDSPRMEKLEVKIREVKKAPRMDEFIHSGSFAMLIAQIETILLELPETSNGSKTENNPKEHNKTNSPHDDLQIPKVPTPSSRPMPRSVPSQLKLGTESLLRRVILEPSQPSPPNKVKWTAPQQSQRKKENRGSAMMTGSFSDYSKRKEFQIGARNAMRCFRCKGAIDTALDEEGMPLMMYHVTIGGIMRYYHPEHFVCEKCEKQIPQTEDFIAENNQIIICIIAISLSFPKVAKLAGSQSQVTIVK